MSVPDKPHGAKTELEFIIRFACLLVLAPVSYEVLWLLNNCLFFVPLSVECAQKMFADTWRNLRGEHSTQFIMLSYWPAILAALALAIAGTRRPDWLERLMPNRDRSFLARLAILFVVLTLIYEAAVSLRAVPLLPISDLPAAALLRAVIVRSKATMIDVNLPGWLLHHAPPFLLALAMTLFRSDKPGAGAT